MARIKRASIPFLPLFLALIPLLSSEAAAPSTQSQRVAEKAGVHLRSVTVEKSESAVVVRDHVGTLLREGKGGEDDAVLVQWAVDAVRPGGSVQMRAGHYTLSRPIEISDAIELKGEGSQTVILPPPGDFAFRFVRTASSRTRAEIVRTNKRTGWDAVVTGNSISNLSIDGGPEGVGKGIYLREIGQATFQDLWILRTTEGAAIYIAEGVIETTFSRIHLLDNGNVKAKEASIVLASQEAGDANNNIHFDNVFVIFPNYIGMEIGAGTGREAPRLIFINQCMFHGWLGQNEAGEGVLIPAPFDLIRVTQLDTVRGMIIRDSRLTNSGETSAYLGVERGEVKAFGNFFGGGRGAYFIRGGESSHLLVTGNTFHSVSNSDGGRGVVLQASGGGVTFKDNTLDEDTGPVRLLRPTYTIVSHNIFRNPGKGGRVSLDIGKDRAKSQGVLISENVFIGVPEGQAIEPVLPSRKGVAVKDNFFIQD